MQIMYASGHCTPAAIRVFIVVQQFYVQLTFVDCVNTMISLQSALRFNGGGHLNHSIFWTNLAPKSGGQPSGKQEVMETAKIL